MIPVLASVETFYSSQRSTLNPKEIAELAASMNMDMIGIADHDMLAGAHAFCVAATKAKIKPVIGERLTTPWGHLLLHVLTAEGWTNLCRFDAAVRFKTATLEFETLRATAPGLYCTLPNDQPLIAKWIAGDVAANETITEIRQAFEGNLAIGLTRATGPSAEDLQLSRLAYGQAIPLVALPSTRRKASEDPRGLQVLAFLRDDEQEATNANNSLDGHHLRSPSEILELYSDIPQAIANARAILEASEFKITSSPPRLPHFPGSFAEEDDLVLIAHEGLEDRIGPETTWPEAYRERLDYELDKICSLGFAGYFLMVSDFVKWAKSQGIAVGPGRGSGAGSLVAWACKITELDPIHYHLFFERFINPERVSPPDFDIDFCVERRDEVIAYLARRYGRDKVARIGAWQTMAARGAWRAAGRAKLLTPGQINRVSKIIDSKAGLKNAPLESPELANMLERDPELAETYELARTVENVVTTDSQHAAGIIIADHPIVDTCPIRPDESGPDAIPITHYNMKSVEDVGLVKFDFLGLDAVTILQNTKNLIAKRGIEIDLDKIPLDDKATFDMLNNGYTKNIFQLESDGITRALKEIRLSTIEDIIALAALYRPGPMEYIPLYANRKANRVPIEYPHPKLIPVLKNTYGIIIYQEQIMAMAQVIAGYSLAGADLLRRAIGKKDPKALAEQKSNFVNGCVDGYITLSLDDGREIKIPKNKKLKRTDGQGLVTAHNAYTDGIDVII